MLRVLRDTDVTLVKPWLVDGTPTNGLTITVEVKDLDGADVITPVAANDLGDGTYSADIDSTEIPDVALLDSIWTNSDGQVVTERLEVVGGWLFSEPQARAYDNGAMQSTSDYEDADILAERDRVTDLLEQLTARSWVPRFRRSVLRGNSSRELWLRERRSHQGGSGGEGSMIDIVQLLAVTVNGSSVPVGNVQIDPLHGILYRTDAAWPKHTMTNPFNVVVDYEYGQQHLINGVDTAALALVRDRLVPSNIPDRAVSWTDEFGNINLDTMPTVARDWIKTHSMHVGIV